MDEIPDKEALHCETCDLTVSATERGKDEMDLHEAECDGLCDPRERFDVGDAVQYSDFGCYRLDREPRTGEIVGFGRAGRGVRVRWDGNKTAEKYYHKFIKPV